jgi:hypothetical protein
LAFLPSEKEEIQTLARVVILSSNAHNESSYLLLHHGRIQKCNLGENNSGLWRCIGYVCIFYALSLFVSGGWYSSYSDTWSLFTWHRREPKTSRRYVKLLKPPMALALIDGSKWMGEEKYKLSRKTLKEGLSKDVIHTTLMVGSYVPVPVHFWKINEWVGGEKVVSCVHFSHLRTGTLHRWVNCIVRCARTGHSNDQEKHMCQLENSGDRIGNSP